MNTIKLVRTKFFSYLDLNYLLKFALLFVCLNYFHKFFVGITQPGNLYFPFLENYLNYVAWVQISIIQAANLLAHAIGIQSYVASQYLLCNPDGSGVSMGWVCAGLGVMSFWSAFIIADKISVKKKALYVLVGIFAIWVVNCVRVTMILVALNQKWEQYNNMDHHEFFNKLSYAVLMIMIWVYTRTNNNNTATAPQ
jgi:exosortase/archaeosortase family protein